MVFNMLAAVAQEESRSISENTKWAIHRKMELGEYKPGCSRILGYDSVNGTLVPNGDKEYQLLSLHGQSKDAHEKFGPGGWEYDIVYGDVTMILSGIIVTFFF